MRSCSNCGIAGEGAGAGAAASADEGAGAGATASADEGGALLSAELTESCWRADSTRCFERF